MAAASVDSIIGQVRAIFRDGGRGGQWLESLGIGNPAAAPIIKKHLKATTVEQSQARVKTKQAPPLFFDKLLKMGRFLNYHAQCKCTSPLASCLFRRDDAFFKLLCHTGDRGSDLGLVQIHQIQWMREGKGIVLEVTAGKTTRGKKGKRSVVLRSDYPELCPILALQRYLTVVENTYKKLTQGYLFRVAHIKAREWSD